MGALKRRMMKWDEYHWSAHEDIVDPGHKDCCYEVSARFAIIPFDNLSRWLVEGDWLRLLLSLWFGWVRLDIGLVEFGQFYLPLADFLLLVEDTLELGLALLHPLHPLHRLPFLFSLDLALLRLHLQLNGSNSLSKLALLLQLCLCLSSCLVLLSPPTLFLFLGLAQDLLLSPLLLLHQFPSLTLLAPLALIAFSLLPGETFHPLTLLPLPACTLSGFSLTPASFLLFQDLSLHLLHLALALHLLTHSFLLSHIH
jgi:hypothetical protein